MDNKKNNSPNKSDHGPLVDKSFPMKIAVVDDSEYSRKSIIEILEKEGFNVAGEANSTKEALEIVANNPCDLYIIDVVMPESSGLELAKLISKQKRQSYILMMSSLSMENMIIEAIALGASDFLQKPFTAEDLIKTVYKIQNHFKAESNM